MGYLPKVLSGNLPLKNVIRLRPAVWIPAVITSRLQNPAAQPLVSLTVAAAIIKTIAIIQHPASDIVPELIYPAIPAPLTLKMAAVCRQKPVASPAAPSAILLQTHWFPETPVITTATLPIPVASFSRLTRISRQLIITLEAPVIGIAQ